MQDQLIFSSFPPSPRRTFSECVPQDLGFCPVTLPPSICFAILIPLHGNTGAALVIAGSHQRIEMDHTYLALLMPFRSMRGRLSGGGFILRFGMRLAETPPKEPLGHKSSVYALVFKRSRSTTSALGDAVVLGSRVLSKLLRMAQSVVTNLVVFTSRRTSDCIGRGQGWILREFRCMKPDMKRSLLSAYVCSAKISNFPIKVGGSSCVPSVL